MHGTQYEHDLDNGHGHGVHASVFAGRAPDYSPARRLMLELVSVHGPKCFRAALPVSISAGSAQAGLAAQCRIAATVAHHGREVAGLASVYTGYTSDVGNGGSGCFRYGGLPSVPIGGSASITTNESAPNDDSSAGYVVNNFGQ